MAFVLLPCDLPTWATIDRLLQPLTPPEGGEEVSAALICSTLQSLHALCNVSIDPAGSEPVPADFFAPLEELLGADAQLLRLTRRALPQLVRAALQLAPLKPPEGLSYSLQQQSDALVIPRPLVSGLVAHTFLNTLPRRSPLSHPTLCNPVMANVLRQVSSEDELFKVRAVLQYFALLQSSPYSSVGNVVIDRKVMGTDSFLRLRRWRESRLRLCRLQVVTEPVSRLQSRPAILACSCTAHPARAALLPNCIQDARGLEPHAELLVTGLLVEKLEDNEAMQISGILSPSSPQVSSPEDLTYALLDPDDYSDSWILQYESINLLRELNKCFLAFSPPISMCKERVIPNLPAGVVLQRPLYAGGVSAASPESSQPPTPTNRGSLDNNFDFPEVTKESRKKSVQGSDLFRTSIENSVQLSKETQNNRERLSQGSGSSKNSGDRSSNSPNASVNKEQTQKESPVQVLAKQTSGSEGKEVVAEAADRNKSSTSATEKKKLPKILELLLPKKILAPLKLKSDSKNSKNERSSGVGSEISDKTSVSDPHDGRESGFSEMTKDENASSTRRKNKPKKNSPDDKTTPADQNVADDHSMDKPTTEAVLSTKCVSFDKEKEKDVSRDCPDDITSDLLNRVLKAIQKLEKEQSIMLKSSPAHEISAENLIPKTDDLNTKSLHKLKNKPPLPDGCRRAGAATKSPRPKSGVIDPAQHDCQYKCKEEASSEVRKLSVYHSCSEERHPQHDEELFFSASESIDVSEDKPRRKGGRRERLPNTRRKHSFAERLKEAMERGTSTDRSSQTSEATGPMERSIPRNNSGGFHLDDQEETPFDPYNSMDDTKANLRRASTIKAVTPKKSENSSDDDKRTPTADQQSAGKQTEKEVANDDDDAGSGSSRYSFSSDYSSDLEEVYDHLEEVLHQLEGATPGPRTAAIAQLAHKLLKRAFSESSKGLSVCADGSFSGGSPERGEARRSMSEGALQGSRGEDDNGVDGAEEWEMSTTEAVTILTDSWGCDELGGNRQLKAMIQWAAASMAGAERVVYCSHSHEALVKLGLVSGLLSDRQWTVGQLTDAILRHCNSALNKWRTRLTAGHTDTSTSDEVLGTTLFDRILLTPEKRTET